MITGDFSKYDSFAQFYCDIKELHEEAHGSTYTDVHEAIAYYINDSKSTDYKYVELGIMQGATLGNAMLSGANNVVGIDVNLSRIEPHNHLLEEYAKSNSIKYQLINSSSLDFKSVQTCDMLYIDSLHKAHHMVKELDLWADYVSDYIIAHDTTSKPELYTALSNFCKTYDNEWEMIERHMANVGYTVLKRKHTQ